VRSNFTGFCWASIYALAVLPSAVLAYPAPAPDTSLPASKVPVAVQQIRREMLEAQINSLTFHNKEEMFTTRSVARSG
jgi:hypothetical protein